VPGLAIVVVHGDRVVFLKGYGLRKVGQPGDVDADTTFQLASLSKPIAATTVEAALVGDQRVGWDDPMLRTLPETRIGPPALAVDVTVRDLLAHRSGLPDPAGDHLEDLGFDRTMILERLRLLATGNRFRADYAYTNFGFTAGAVAAANAVGRP
jgi:CubicO group peptidase (beta-lactamase class C family)